jgi:hypothetical protein
VFQNKTAQSIAQKSQEQEGKNPDNMLIHRLKSYGLDAVFCSVYRWIHPPLLSVVKSADKSAATIKVQRFIFLTRRANLTTKRLQILRGYFLDERK